MNERSNLIVRLWNGDVGLAKTYWLFSVLIGGVGFRIVSLILENTYSYGAVLILLLINIAYSGLMIVAIWRSASKYQGKKIWAILAKIATILGAFLLVGAVLGLIRHFIT